MHFKDAQFAWQRYLAGDSRGARALAPAAILAATFLAYAGTLGFGFVFDDTAGIVRNDSLRAWRYLPSYFTSHVWSFLYPHLLSNYYRPLFLLWLRLNDALFGLHPWGWHLTSVAAHVAVTYLVYCLGLRLTRDAWIAAFAGLIFGLDPVHVEAVAYVSAVPELLCAVFVLAALLAWLRTREGGLKRTWLAAALALYSAALLSKESGMMLPIFIALYAWIYAAGDGGEVGLGKRLRTALEAVAPFLVVTLFYVPLRVWALKGFAHTVTPVGFPNGDFNHPFSADLLSAPVDLACWSELLLRHALHFCRYAPQVLFAARRDHGRAGRGGRMVFPDAAQAARGSAHLGVCGPLDDMRDPPGPQLPALARGRNRPRPLPLPSDRGVLHLGGACAGPGTPCWWLSFAACVGGGGRGGGLPAHGFRHGAPELILVGRSLAELSGP